MAKPRMDDREWMATLTEKSGQRWLEGEQLRCAAMPLGGIGAGSLALCGDGSLRQWQLVNQVNHLGYVPGSFFAVSARTQWGRPSARLLMSDRFATEQGFQPAPAVSDHVVPSELAKLMAAAPCVGATRFRGVYPVAELEYSEPALPVKVTLEAFSPFVPGDPDASGWPAVLFEFRLKNVSDHPQWATVLASLQNLVGWDNRTSIRGVRCHQYGGNSNHLARSAGLTAVEMRNGQLDARSPEWGQVCVAAHDANASFVTQWADFAEFWAEFERTGGLPNEERTEPSAAWQTWNGAVAIERRLAPGEEATALFSIAWYFPNRYVNWSNIGPFNDDKSLFWLGNAYNRLFDSALDVAVKLNESREELRAATRAFARAMQADLPAYLADCAGANLSTLRTPICFRTEDGHFYGFEGGNGESTGGMHLTGGCCPLNCTHVWNYEQSLGFVFPSLARSMREVDWQVQQHETGYLPHRVTLPHYLPRTWGAPIGGPENPAADGLFAGILKTLREFRMSGDMAWLSAMWPGVNRAIDYAMTHYDRGDGVIEGEQPNTYDIHVYGPNTFIGTQYLAALRATEEMATALGLESRAYRDRFEKGSIAYNEICWNGEFYIQRVDHAKHGLHQWGEGCHSDQLLGQWWAHLLGLGYLLPAERVKSSLKAIYKYNFKADFYNISQSPRVFASQADRGLLNCSWPAGGRPETPILYADEVWTGIEYQVAAHLIYEGMFAEGLQVVRAARDRYDGFERSPWNEVECGDHYTRPLSSWSVLLALTGLQWNAHTGTLKLDPAPLMEEFSVPFVLGTAFGQVLVAKQGRELRLAGGHLSVRRFEGEASVNGKSVNGEFQLAAGDVLAF